MRSPRRSNFFNYSIPRSTNKGSAFGAIGLAAQPSQEMFENKLALGIHQQNSNHSNQPIWIEDESQRIGSINIPHNLWALIRTQPVYFLDIPFEERLKHIVSEYGSLDKEKLSVAVSRIQKRFGPNGDLLLQKAVLVKPIQDQIFTIVQDLADSKKYDFIFDKSSDLTMLFASKRYDISDQVLRTLTRAEQREQLTKKQLKLQQEKDAKEDFIKENPDMVERQRILDEKKTAREKLAAEKKAAIEEKKRIAAENKKKALEEKKAVNSSPKKSNLTDSIAAKKANDKLVAEATRKAAAEAKAKALEDRKKELEDRKKKILEDREAAKKAKEDKLKEKPIN